MSASPTNPPKPDGTDPSMEEILASIRKILNEDDVPVGLAEHTPPPDDVLVLDESMMVKPDEPAPVVTTMPVVETAPAMPAAVSEPKVRDQAELVAPEAAAAAASSLGNLVRTLSAGRTTHVHAGGPTLEDLVRVELRPMLRDWTDAHFAACAETQLQTELRQLLKTWLDENLPGLVERLVRAEIQRVIGRAMP